MNAWWQRLNRRERMLLMIVGGVVLFFANWFVLGTLAGMGREARATLASQKAAREQQEMLLSDRKIWEKRGEWLAKNQPAFTSAGEASTLLDEVKQVAGKHNIQLENPAIGTGDATPNYQPVFVSVETKSPWPPLVRFLYDMQKPGSFIVFESVNLAIDSTDPTMMRGKFKIARWFAPAQP